MVRRAVTTSCNAALRTEEREGLAREVRASPSVRRASGSRESSGTIERLNPRELNLSIITNDCPDKMVTVSALGVRKYGSLTISRLSRVTVSRPAR